MRVAITGVNGFIGSRARHALESWGTEIVPVTRRPTEGCVAVGDLGSDTDWSTAVAGVDAVIHLAARVHISRETSTDPQEEFTRANVGGSGSLVRACLDAGVRRMVFLSTAGVFGSSSKDLVTDSSPTNPQNLYAESKLEAEELVRDMTENTSLSTVILRAPLVYGEGARGNLDRLRVLIQRGMPLPLGSVNNRRSAIAIGNLTSALKLAAESERVSGRSLLVEDGTHWSSREMAEWVGRSIGRAPRLLPVPAGLARFLLAIGRRDDLAERLVGSLVVDGSQFRELTGWVPPVAVDDALAQGVV